MLDCYLWAVHAGEAATVVCTRCTIDDSMDRHALLRACITKLDLKTVRFNRCFASSFEFHVDEKRLLTTVSMF